MPVTPEVANAGLREMLAEAIRAYELTRIARVTDQRRAEELLDVVGQMERAAHDLLRKAGLAHIVGAPLGVNDPLPTYGPSDHAIAAAFADAALARSDLRAALLRLAELHMSTMQFEEAHHTLQSLLAPAQRWPKESRRSCARRISFVLAKLSLPADLKRAKTHCGSG